MARRRAVVVVDVDGAEIPALVAGVHDECRRDAACQCRRKQLVRGGRAAVAADRFRLVCDHPVLAVDHDLVAERAADRACGGGEAHAVLTALPCLATMSSRKRPIAAGGCAATKPVTGVPSRNTATVGMLRMP